MLSAEPNLIIVSLYIALKKIRTNTASQSDIVLANHVLAALATNR